MSAREGKPIAKARYWLGVLYPENMVDGWEDSLGDIVQVPYAYCIHDSDHNIDGEDRKTHVHMILVFANTTTYKHALAVFRLLGAKAINKCEAAVNIRHSYDYLIHDTETCRKQGKYQYPPEARIEGNNFDIGAYEQMGTAEKQAMLKELVGFIMANGYTTINDFTEAAAKEYPDSYWDIIVGYNGVLERYCRGNYLKWKQRQEVGKALKNGPQTHENTLEGAEKHTKAAEKHTKTHLETHENTCPNCGSSDIRKNGKTAADQQRYRCMECGKSFV